MSKHLKIAILGVGGVGGYIGAKLAQNGHDVTLIARGKHFEAIKQQGLHVNDNGETFTVHPQLIHTEDREALQNITFDVVFITTKSYDFQNACAIIADSLHASTLIIPLANGVNHKAELQNYLHTGILCDGCVYILSNIESYGVIHKKNETFYLLFGSEREDEKFTLLAELLNASGLKSKYSNTIEYDCWKKYLFIAPFATLTSYFKRPIGYVVKEERELLDAVLAELKAVANALAIRISEEDIAKVIRQAENVPYDSKTSMQIDFEKGHQTELEVLCGYIVREAKRLGIEVVNMERMYGELVSL